jgi:hypothetical protein
MCTQRSQVRLVQIYEHTYTLRAKLTDTQQPALAFSKKTISSYVNHGHNFCMLQCATENSAFPRDTEQSFLPMVLATTKKNT